MEYAIYMVLFVVGFYLGYKVNEKIMETTFMHMLTKAGITDAQIDQFIRHWAPEMGEDADELLGTESVSIRVEQHSGVLYAFRKDNEEFLGQGPTSEELVKIIAQRFRDVKFTITEEDGAGLIKTL